MLLWKKKDGTLRICIDLRKVNNMKINNMYMFSRIGDLFDQLKAEMMFSNIDSMSCYH